jgi:hypothetical protein
MGRQGGGRLRTSIADQWARILDAAPRPEPVEPTTHIDCRWCASAWECPRHPPAGNPKPLPRRGEQ